MKEKIHIEKMKPEDYDYAEAEVRDNLFIKLNKNNIILENRVRNDEEFLKDFFNLLVFPTDSVQVKMKNLFLPDNSNKVKSDCIAIEEYRKAVNAYMSDEKKESYVGKMKDFDKNCDYFASENKVISESINIISDYEYLEFEKCNNLYKFKTLFFENISILVIENRMYDGVYCYPLLIRDEDKFEDIMSKYEKTHVIAGEVQWQFCPD